MELLDILPQVTSSQPIVKPRPMDSTDIAKGRNGFQQACFPSFQDPFRFLVNRNRNTFVVLSPGDIVMIMTLRIVI